MVAKVAGWVSDFTCRIGCRTRPQEPMSRHTTLGVGGLAELLAWIEDERVLLEAWRFLASRGISRRVLGRGSNILVSDLGLAGATLKLAGKLASIKLLNSGRWGLEVEAGCGCSLDKLLVWARDREGGGLEGLVGIPGTVGGALKLNAGTSLGCIGDRLLEACMLRRGRLGWVTADSLGFGYRRSSIGPRQVAVTARFRLPRRTSQAIRRAFDSALRKRADQPRGVRSAGCFFKNPMGAAAGRLIEQAGCKGASLGGALVSTRHANYIINTGGASASDILRLARKVMREVRRKRGVRLEREVELWGWVRGKVK